ncbi:DUF6533 domain-containing protein [Sporobolomyces koalae]|uniref:DUF6533 domain-containing protein n=1 Tax=Sporobolomyces koalae TaxID=500713 RepID=UPI0031779E74
MYDLERLREVAEATKLCLVVWTAILAWDWLATLPSEYRTIWRRQWSLLKVVFLLNRYGTLLLEIASAAIILAPMSKGLNGFSASLT